MKNLIKFMLIFMLIFMFVLALNTTVNAMGMQDDKEFNELVIKPAYVEFYISNPTEHSFYV